MAFTPSNLYVMSMGSSTLYIAKVNASITSGTNTWTSSITNLLGVWGDYNGLATSTDSGFGISFSATDGAITVNIAVSQSGTPFTMYAMTGLGVKGT